MASEISQEFEPKDNKQAVLYIEVVTWSSPIAKIMYLGRNFYRVFRQVSCPEGQLFSKRRFLFFQLSCNLFNITCNTHPIGTLHV